MTLALISSDTRITELGDGRTTVTTAGTAVQISSTDTPCGGITITAETDNTNIVTVGASTVVAALSTRRGHPLSPGGSITIPNTNLNQVWIDAITATEGVTYVYYK